ncbi:MAG: peptide chain release factor N(5)-glutamine methyltransferase [Nitrospiria bacterium]
MTQSAMASVKGKTVFDLLGEGTAYLKEKGLPSARLETEHLLSASLSCRRIDLYRNMGKTITTDEHSRFWKGLKRRAAHEPLQYITGTVTFFGIPLHIRPGVFIPRPETELMVEAALKIFPTPKRILDLCTGSGSVALALATHLPSSALIFAADQDEAALRLAKINIGQFDTAPNIGLFRGNLLEALARKKELLFDLIVCNPPYISEADKPALPRNVRDFEPAAALFADEEGTAIHRRVLSDAPHVLAEEGRLLLELGAGQATWLKQHIESETGLTVTLINDWAGIPRIAEIQKLPRSTHG